MAVLGVGVGHRRDGVDVVRADRLASVTALRSPLAASPFLDRR